MTKSHTSVPAPADVHGKAIFEAYRPLEWSEDFAKHYNTLTNSIGAVAAELGVSVEIPDQRPANLTIVSSALLCGVRRETGNGDFSRQVVTALKEAGRNAPSTAAGYVDVISLPTLSDDENTPENVYFGLRVAGLKDEQHRLLDVVAAVADIDVAAPSMQISVAGIHGSDWNKHRRAFIEGIVNRDIVCRSFDLGRLVTPTHVGTA